MLETVNMLNPLKMLCSQRKGDGQAVQIFNMFYMLKISLL